MASRRRRLVLAGAAVVAGFLACTNREILTVVIGSVSVNPPVASLSEGQTLSFSALALDESGRPVDNAPVEWSTDDPSVLRVSANGVVEALRQGTAKVIAVYMGTTGEASVVVHPVPVIGTDPSSLTFRGLPGSTPPAAQTVSVTNTVAGGGPIENLSVSVDFSGDPSWLTATLSSARTPATLTVTPQTNGLAAGAYSATITITDQNPRVSPAVIPATLTLSSIAIGESDGTLVEEVVNTTDAFTVALESEPSSNVVLRVTSTDTDEVTVAPPALTFTPGNWSVEQTVTVTGRDDFIDDGDVPVDVRIVVDDDLSDEAFDDLPDLTVPVTVVDNGAGIVVTQSDGGSEVSEAGTQDDLVVVLNGLPTGNVVLTVSSGDLTEVTVAPTSLTFTTANWNQPRTVTLTGVNDALIDNDRVSNVTIGVNDGSSVNGYDPVEDVVVPVTTKDDDIAGIVISQSDNDTQVAESAAAGRTDTLRVSLRSQPASNVVVNVASGTPAQATINRSTLTFTTVNWSTQQTVVVTAVDDSQDDGNVVVPVTFSVSDGGSDDAYDPLPDQVVQVTTLDDDGADFVLSGTGSLTVSESGGTPDVFTVVLTAQPVSAVRLTVIAADPGEVEVLTPEVTFLTSDWNTPKNVRLLGVDDAIDDGNVSSSVTIKVDAAISDPAFAAADSQTVMVTTTDNDAAVVTLGVDRASISESAPDNAATVTATLSLPSTQTVTVHLDFGGTATPSIDYSHSGTENTIVIPPMSTSGFLTIDAVADAIDEPNETATVAIESVPNASGSGSVTVTIVDDDVSSVMVNDVTEVEGSGLQFTVTLNSAVQGGTTVNVTLSGGTATGGAPPLGTPEDYNMAVGQLTFAGTAGETEQFTVATLDDAVVEGNETFIVALNASNTLVTDTDTGTGTINDNDVAAVTVNDVSAVEGSGLQFTVMLNAAVQGGTTVDVALSGGTATGGAAPLATPDDYNNAVSQLTFAGTAGETEQFTVTTLDDAVVEGTESFTVSLNASSPLVADTDTGTGTINDNDVSALTVNDASAAEGGGLQFTASLASAVPGGFTVNVTLSGGSATGGAVPLVAPEDYDNAVAPLVFAGTGGETVQFTVPTLDDAVAEGTETFTVSLSASSPLVTDTDTGTGTITDNDVSAVTVNDVSDVEGSGLQFTVTLTSAVQGGTTVNVTLSGGTATGGAMPLVAPEDYNNVLGQLTFAGSAGETEQFTVTTLDDAVVEGAETFGVALNASSPLVTDADTGTGTISDNDLAAVTVDNAAATEGGGLQFTVTLSSAVQGGTTVNVTLTDVEATGGVDYDNVVTPLVFAGTAGETEQFTVATLEDAVVEGTETFTVSLNATNAMVTDSDTGTGTINDDDASAVTVDNASSAEGEGMLFTVTLGSAVLGGTTVNVTLSGGDATGGADYNSVVGPLVFAGTAGETEQFTVATIEDAIVEVDETFTVSLNATNPLVTDTDTGTGTINDDDASAVTVNDMSATEGGGLQFTVTLSNAVAGGTTVNVTLSGGTATGGSAPLVAPEDYNNVVGQLTFAGTAGETEQFTVATLEDVIAEGAETFSVSLTAANPLVTDTDSGTGTINDNDLSAVTVNDVTGSEGNGLQFTVTLGNAVQGGTTVNVTLSGVEATGGVDYNSVVGQLSFGGTAGETEQFTVTTLEDTAVEGAETFTVSLNATNPLVTDTDTGTGTITDDDASAVTVNDVSAEEGSGLQFTVTLSNAVVGGTTVNVTLSGGSATGGVDYNSTVGPLVFAGSAGETEQFTVGTLEDTDVEGAETFTVSLNATNSLVTDTDTGAGTITDDDTSAVTVNNMSAEEGNGLQFTVTLSNAVPGGTTVNVSLSGGEATGGVDYDNVVSALTFAGTAGETEQFTVATLEDAVVEGGETFTVSLDATNSLVTDTDTGNGTITDDDVSAVTVNDMSATEGGGLQFTVTLGSAVQGGTTVNVTLSGGTATGGAAPLVAPEDFNNVVGQLAFAGTAGETEQFTVATLEDAVVEGSETFAVSLNATHPLVTDSDTGTGTITDNDMSAVTVNDVTGTEGNGLQFTVTLGNAVQGGTTVNVTLSGGTATGGAAPLVAPEDYDNVVGQLVFAGTTGETEQFTVATLGDTEVEVDETFTVSLNATSALVTDTDTGIGTITDDDDAPALLTILTEPPTTSLQGVSFTQSPVVEVRNAGSNPVSGVSVTASIASGGGSVGGTTTVVTNASGTATFSNLSITFTGLTAGPRTLRFAAGGLEDISSGIHVAYAAGTYSDVQYCGTDPLQRMDVSIPSNTLFARPLPVVAYVHGGGWIAGDKTDNTPLMTGVRTELLSRGYVVVSLNYRLGDTNPWPAQINDVKCAIRHLRAEAADYGSDGVNIGVWGWSAGGHLASMLGVTDAASGFEGSGGYGTESSRVNAVVDIAGISDMTAAQAPTHSELDFPGPDITFGSNWPGPSTVLDNASPVTWTSADDPPFLLIHGEDDVTVLPAQSSTLLASLAADGVTADLVTVTDGPHNLQGATASPTLAQLYEQIGNFFDAHVGSDP